MYDTREDGRTTMRMIITRMDAVEKAEGRVAVGGAMTQTIVTIATRVMMGLGTIARRTQNRAARTKSSSGRGAKVTTTMRTGPGGTMTGEEAVKPKGRPRAGQDV